MRGEESRERGGGGDLGRAPAHAPPTLSARDPIVATLLGVHNFRGALPTPKRWIRVLRLAVALAKHSVLAHEEIHEEAPAVLCEDLCLRFNLDPELQRAQPADAFERGVGSRIRELGERPNRGNAAPSGQTFRTIQETSTPGFPGCGVDLPPAASGPHLRTEGRVGARERNDERLSAREVEQCSFPAREVYPGDSHALGG